MNKKINIRNIRPESLVFNYSSVQLTEDMSNLLNRGLNFSILPLKLDITQILVDFRKYERSIIWHEFWFGRETENEYEKPMFKTHKTLMPKNHTTPKGLLMYLNAIKSELLDPRNRNKSECNIPPGEVLALKTLVRLQRERVIKIMACDKGAGIIILNFEEYLKSCYEHLESVQKQADGTTKPYYIQINEIEIEKAKMNIYKIIEEGIHHNYISHHEFNEMNPLDKYFGRFYCNFKVHKDHIPMSAPPPRPIVSVSGSFSENIGMFVEYHIKDLVWKYPDILQDTTDFLRCIESEINKNSSLSKDSILVVADVSALFTNIPADDSLECLTNALNGRKDQQIPTGFIVRLMEAILENNFFTFNSEYFKQNIGASMGQRPIPSLANIFMAQKIDLKIRELSEKYSSNQRKALQFLKRFLDDIFMIFNGSSKKLHQLFEGINLINPSIKLTMTHTSIENESEEDKCNCTYQERIPFLDTSCAIKDNKIDIDLFRKETDRNRYLLPSSCHPKQTTTSIPISLSMRIVRICTDPRKRDIRLGELKSLLMDRNYQEYSIDRAIKKAKSIPRHIALKKVKKTENNKQASVCSAI